MLRSECARRTVPEEMLTIQLFSYHIHFSSTISVRAALAAPWTNAAHLVNQPTNYQLYCHQQCSPVDCSHRVGLIQRMTGVLLRRNPTQNPNASKTNTRLNPLPIHIVYRMLLLGSTTISLCENVCTRNSHNNFEILFQKENNNASI